MDFDCLDYNRGKYWCAGVAAILLKIYPGFAVIQPGKFGPRENSAHEVILFWADGVEAGIDGPRDHSAGKAKAMYVLPLGVPSFPPPPAAITTNCRPSTLYVQGVA